MALYLVMEGDSLTVGFQATGWDVYPLQLAVKYTDERMVSVTNQAVNASVMGGAATPNITSRASIVDACYDSRKSKNVLVLFGGTNDMHFGDTGATTYSRLVPYCQARQATGYKVVVLTAMPRSDAGNAVGFEAERQTYNASIRANWRTFADALVDVALDARIGLPGCQLDTTYFNGDQVHMTPAGYGVVASLVRPGVDSV
jgi:lysophospholipase L1-like esterase